MARRRNAAGPDGILSRREFARRAALAAVTAAVAPGELLAGPSAATATPPPRPLADASVPLADERKLSPAARAEVEAKTEAIYRKHGERLSEEQKKDIRRLVTESQSSLENLRSFQLENSNQPATVLKLHPEAAGSPRGGQQKGRRR